MIRPITMICWILALSAGLYLYRAKHEVELMDRHIDQIAKETNDLRVESRRLLDDWIRLGEPEQLRRYSDQYLGLKSIVPSQFVRLTDLPNRLPPPQADPVEQPADQTPVANTTDQFPAVASAEPSAAEPSGMDEAETDSLPVPPIPPTGTAIGQLASATVIVPLQARPVTPRSSTGSQEQDATRPAASAPSSAGTPHLADEPHVASTKPAEPKPMKLAEPRSLPEPTPIQPNLGQSAQTPSRVASAGSGQIRRQELPPLQAQAPAQARAMPQPVAMGQASQQAFGYRQADLHADTWSQRPVQTQSGFQGTASRGSLLGVSRGNVPAPLPAPTPVNATWTNAGGR